MTLDTLCAMRWVEQEGNERGFVVERGGQDVPGVLWTPGDADEPFPLVLAGHGYLLNKRVLFPTTLPADLTSRGLAVAAIDASEHGERALDGGRDAAAVDRAFRAHWRSHGGTEMAADWRAALDELARLPEIDERRAGYWGLSLGTQTGLAFLASEPRVRAAVLGLSALPDPGPRIAEYAGGVRCPVFFIQQLDDETATLERSQALYEAIGSEDKTLRSSAGAHTEVPAAVFEEAYAFLAERLE
ncbi:MAG: alpha/beta hydrolase [Dehalococcoidia bacterium]